VILSKDNPFEGASFSLRNRLARLSWQIVWLLLFRPTPPQLHSWRCWLLRRFGARIDKGCHIYSDVCIWAPWNLEMGSQSCLGPRVNCYSMAMVRIGERAIVSQGAYLCTGTHDYSSLSFQLIAKPINIGADAWVCAEVFLGPGVQIGEGAVIGARAVVTRSQKAWTVCAGNPAQVIKFRKHPRAFQNPPPSSTCNE
jgi:putative colanic acid biosynthesis acetyltransferase WcaF